MSPNFSNGPEEQDAYYEEMNAMRDHLGQTMNEFVRMYKIFQKHDPNEAKEIFVGLCSGIFGEEKKKEKKVEKQDINSEDLPF